jgi:hypothetical protein
MGMRENKSLVAGQVLSHERAQKALSLRKVVCGFCASLRQASTQEVITYCGGVTSSIIRTLRAFSRHLKHINKLHLQQGGSMKFLRASMIAIALSAVSIAFGYAQFGVTRATEQPQTPAFCAKCGDGQCQKSCGETATTCPRDCGGGGVPQKSAH